MRKYLAPVFVAAFLCGNLALCETEKYEIAAESEEINEEYIYFYEFILSNQEMTDQRKMAYKNSYRTFLISVSEEHYRNDPELYEGLIEE